MARYPFEEHTTVIWVPGDDGVANIEAPTLAEIAAGSDVTCFITRDGLNPGGTNNKVDGAGLCTRIDGQTVGTVGYDFTLRMFRDNASGGDDAWDLANWGDLGFLVVRRGVMYGDVFAAGQAVEVYEAQMGEPIPASSAQNTSQAFELGLAIANAELKAVVAA